MIKQIAPEETYPLRRKVLRKNMPQETHVFQGDNKEGTFHLGFFERNQLVGVVTLMPQEAGIFQLRGMAVDERFQGMNIGRHLVKEAEEIVRNSGGTEIWMNAREAAIPFYQKCGYQKVGEYFEILPIGVHIKMQRKLNDPAHLLT